MAKFCLPQNLVDTLKKGVQAGEIDLIEMVNMSSKQRRELLTKYVDRKTAININAGFETAMSSKYQGALKAWAEDLFTPAQQESPKYRDVISKINTLEEAGLLNPKTEEQFLQDLVATRLGATITAEEASMISDKAGKLKALESERSEFGTPSLEYFKARKEMEDYLDSITPSPKLRVATSTIGRGNMLASVKSPLLNIESNTVTGFINAIERRLSTGKFKGMNGDYGIKYMKFAMKVFKESGYDVTRMQSLESKRKILGEEFTTSQGPGKTRKIGRFYEDVVFKKLLGEPDVAFASAHFIDSANLASAKIAEGKGFRGQVAKDEALRIFKDSTRIDPQTLEGKVVREQAMADASYATYTNDSVVSDIALGIRKLFNIASGDVRLGDQIMPFVKTPANVIGAGLESSGVLVPVDVTMRMFKTLKDIKEGSTFNEASAENFRGLSRRVVRAGLGMTFAFLLASIFDPEDFIGEYPVSEKERQLLRERNATTNSVKIGDKWVSLDYFGVLGSPLVGMLYAKKYGKDAPTFAYYYTRGVVRQAGKIPGFTEFYDYYKAIDEQFTDTRNTLEENINATANFAIDFIRARLVPGLVYDTARMTDKFERKYDYKDPLEKTMNTIPGLRQRLPVRRNTFGDEIKSEGWKTLLFGSRVKTSIDNEITNELVRLDQTGNLPSISDYRKTSKRAKNLEAQIGEEKMDEAMKQFGDWFKEDLSYLLEDSYYLESPDDEKKELIEDVRSNAFEDMLDAFNYEPPEPE